MAARSTDDVITASKRVRSRVYRGGERFWRHTDFADLPPAAVSQALSRLTKRGELERVRKGVAGMLDVQKVTLEDAVEADRIFTILMGDQVEPRREFIETHAKYVKNLDV